VSDVNSRSNDDREATREIPPTSRSLPLNLLVIVTTAGVRVVVVVDVVGVEMGVGEEVAGR
jgi:hypothetical protein